VDTLYILQFIKVDMTRRFLRPDERDKISFQRRGGLVGCNYDSSGHPALRLAGGSTMLAMTT
jgi:hypothetical protein